MDREVPCRGFDILSLIAHGQHCKAVGWFLLALLCWLVCYLQEGFVTDGQNHLFLGGSLPSSLVLSH